MGTPSKTTTRERDTVSISEHFDTLPEMTDDEALNLITAIRAKHRFAGIIFTRADVEAWMDETDFGRPTNEYDVDLVVNSWEWDHMADILSDDAWSAILDAANEAVADNSGKGM
jgi:hypothetical protein